jgi:hypothetical protein
MNTEEILAQRVAELEALNAQLRAKGTPKVRLKVSEKGALSVYGLGRFPTTLYPEQMTRLLEHSDEIKTFLTEHKDEFSTKKPVEVARF